MQISLSAPDQLPEVARIALRILADGQLSIIDVVGAAGQLTDLGSISLAVALYRAWLAQTESPLAYAIQFNLGLLLEQLDDSPAAEAAYRAAIAQNSEFIEARLALAHLLNRTRPIDEAAEPILANTDIRRLCSDVLE